MLAPSEVERVVALVADQAASSFAGPHRYFRDLVARAHLPRGFEQSLAGVWTGDARLDARALVGWAAVRGTNPADPRLTVLGALLKALLDDLGLEGRAQVAALVHKHRMFHDAALAANLVAGMQVPTPLGGEARVAGGEAVGPEIEWRGPEGEIELQGLFRPEPDWFDVGFLSRAIARAAGVCRVEVGATGARGTGFLLAGKDLVLTNYHVFDGADGGLESAARSTELRFGCFTVEGGDEAEGRTFATHPDTPLLKSSPTDALDYALLRLEPAIHEAERIEPAPLSFAQPVVGSGLHLLQHPLGGPMKVAFSDDGVAAVIGGRLVQYVSRSAVGSGGAPCFDSSWRVVALHHAERSRTFGTIREGVLLAAIHPEVRELLPPGG